MIPSSDIMVLTDAEGRILSGQSVDISSDAAHPTTVHYAFIDRETGEVDPNQRYTVQVYAGTDTNGTQVTFEMTGVTVGVSVPDITFDADIAPLAVKDSDRIHASAYISGTSDVRAYSETAGNMDSVTIGIIKLTSTRLVKAVDKRYIELDGVFTYTVTYTNSGNENVDVYLYDLMPDVEDIRDSDYEGEAILREITANLSGGDGIFNAEIQFYYSKTQYTQLYEMVRVFGDGQDGGYTIDERKARILQMLTNTRYFTPLGTISAANNHAFQISPELSGKTPEELTEEMRQTTGIYAVVTGLSGGKSLSINMTVQAKDNEAGDVYRNIANSWLGDASDALTSNMVETSVLARTISGVVWYDADFNGERNDDERLIPGVTCTLFRLDENEKTANGEPNPDYGKYVICTKDVTGGDIRPVTTGADGAYTFEKLAAGKYIVAFSGDGLKQDGENEYIGATTYRANGENDGTTNDAVALGKTESGMDTEVSAISGIDSGKYPYVIAYSLEDEKTVNAAPLHTIDSILDNNILLVNHVELYANLDCGLIIAGYELPDTGGSGTIPYTVGGMLVISAGLLLLYIYKKRRRGEVSAF
nr:LPXTG cell wall anchor domain-containing protein [uncultured Marvinbryantia sp.]